MDRDGARIARHRRGPGLTVGAVRDELAEFDYAGIVLFDPLNFRYAVGVTNMMVCTTHNPVRYVIEPGMCLTVGSYVGRKDGGEGVKLEEHLVVTETGTELLSSFAGVDGPSSERTA